MHIKFTALGARVIHFALYATIISWLCMSAAHADKSTECKKVTIEPPQLNQSARSGAESAFAKITDGLVDLLLRIHHERTVLRDRFVQRPTGDQQHA